MSLDYDFAAVSATAGPASDGIPVGGIFQSLLGAALSNATVAPTVYVYRKNRAAGSVSFVPITSLANFEPFGATVDMSAGDELYVACGNPVKEIYVRIATPGVWVGTGLSIGYSSDGRTVNRAVANLIDGSNGFRNAVGTYRLTWDAVTDAQAFSPQPGTVAEIAAGDAIESRDWRVIRLVGLSAVTTAPVLTGLWIIHADSSITYSDLTTSYNSVLTDGVFTGAPAEVFYPIGTERHWVLPFLGYGMDHAIHRRLGGATAVTASAAAEYHASDDSWKPLPDYVSGSTFFSAGPATLGNPVQNFTERWSVPADWTAKTMTLPVTPLGGGAAANQTYTGYHIRHRVTAISPAGPLAPSLARSRARVYGAANSYGDQHGAAKTYAGVSIMIDGTVPTVEMVMQGVNLHTGASRRFTIDANPARRSVTRAFSSPLVIAAGQELLPLQFVSGGSATSARLRYYE